MNPLAKALVIAGCFLLLGLVADFLGRRTPFPRVTILLLVGLAFGPSGFNLLGSEASVWFQVVGDIALGIIGFTIGGELTLDRFRERGGAIVWIAVVQAVVTALVVAVGLLALGAPPILALLLGGIATATAPAATVSVTRELESKGPLTRTLRAVVALDDLWALLTFSLLMAVASMLAGHNGAWISIWMGIREIFGGILLGVLIGVPLAYLSGRIRPGDPTVLEVLGAILLLVGLASGLELSYLLAAVMMGALVANLASHHERPFHAIEEVQTPFLVLFFLLAGVTLELDVLASAGWIGACYIVLRTFGKVIGCRFGSWFVNAEPAVRQWLGISMLPHAGVAIGMALFSRNHFPEIAELLMSVVLSATVVFELAGPVLTRLALTRSGEAAGGSDE